METDASDQAMDECNALINWALPLAEDLVIKHGTFYPFGGSMDGTGIISANLAESNNDDPEYLYNMIKTALIKAARTGQVKATVLVHAAFVQQPGSVRSDAMAFSVDHVHGESIAVFVPYVRTEDNYTASDMISQPGAADIFSQ